MCDLPIPDLEGFSHGHLFGKGVCIHCGIPLPGTPFKAPRCVACNAVKRVIYRARIEAGFCPYCPNKVAPGYSQCDRHRHQGAKKKTVRRPVTISRWDFARLHQEYTSLVESATKLLDELWAMGGDEDTLLEFVFEAENDRDAALATLCYHAGWTRQEYLDAASNTIVLGDGRVVKKASGVFIKRYAA